MNVLMKKLVVMLIACEAKANRSWSQSWFKCKCGESLLMLRAGSWQIFGNLETTDVCFISLYLFETSFR